MIGQTVSHYRIIERLGAGGMGTVYLAEDTVLGRRVAIKTLTDTGPASQHFRTRFLREARAVSTLSHPHIATIHDYGETPDGQPYIVMEFIRGETLADLMLKESLTIPRALEIISEVAEALGEAHNHGIIHRDIKPSNIAINQRGEVKVLDFGLAKQIEPGFVDSLNPEGQTLLNTQTREGVIVGTPMYLSPEQALGVEVDRRSDLFSLGAVLYECLAGKPPFFGGSAVEICARVIRDDPAPPSQVNKDVSVELDRIALKALAKKPEARYQTAAELITDLDAARAEAAGHNQTITRTVRVAPGTQPTGALATLSNIFKRPRLPVGYVAIGIVALTLIAIGGWYVLAPKAHQPTAEAKRLFDLGVEAIHDGSYHKASRLLQRAVQADPEFALGRARLAEVWTELDYADRAKDELLSVNELERSAMSEVDKLYVGAVTATVKRDFPKAVQSYSQMLRLQPNDAAAFIDLGRAYEKNEQVDEAIANFAEATKRKPDAAAAYVRLGVLHFRKLDKNKASTNFDLAEKLYQESGNFEGNAEVLLERGVLLKQRGELKLAHESLQKALEIARIADSKSQQVKSKLQLSGVFYSEGNTAEAKQQAREAVDLARSNDMENLTAQGLLDLGYAFFVGRAYSEAEEYFRQALDIAVRNKGKRNEARALLSFGALFIQQEQPNKGRPYIERALEFYRPGAYGKEISQCLLWLARAQLLKAEFDSAIKTLDEQYNLAKRVDDPAQLARSQEELASALGKLEFYPQALVRYTESAQLFKSLGNAFHTAFCLLNRADMLARLGRHEEAFAVLDELSPLLTALPADNNYKPIWTAFAFLIRAQMNLSQRRLPEARANCKEALATIAGKDPKTMGNTEAAIKETLGLVEVYSGAPASGVKLCQEALQLIANREDHESGDSHLALAEALLESGQAKLALDYALKAQESFAARHRSESEWRTLITAGRASALLGDQQAQADRYAQAQKILAAIRARWGEEAFILYSARKDIHRSQSYLSQS
jgi:tetratricopeptide (TPR) repeat protein